MPRKSKRNQNNQSSQPIDSSNIEISSQDDKKMEKIVHYQKFRLNEFST